MVIKLHAGKHMTDRRIAAIELPAPGANHSSPPGGGSGIAIEFSGCGRSSMVERKLPKL